LNGRGPQGFKAALREGATVAAGAALGIGGAAFYVVPASTEQSWVKISMPFLRGVRYQDNLLFGHIGDPAHDAILRSASLCGVGLVAFALVAMTVAYGREQAGQFVEEGNARRQAIVCLGLVTGCIAFLLTSPSAILWRHLPKLVFLQFPWRFCAVLGATSAALLALALGRTKLHPAVAVTIGFSLTLALTLGGNACFRQVCFPSFDVAGIVESFWNGGRYDYTDEYPPVGADGEKLQHANPSFWIAKSPADSAPARAGNDYSVALSRRLEFTVTTPVPAFVVLSLRDYPAWRVTINGRSSGARPHRDDGLMVLPVAGGISHIGIAYVNARDTTAGWMMTTVSAMVLLLIWRRERGRAGVGAGDAGGCEAESGV